jgi:hypothetical protein
MAEGERNGAPLRGMTADRGRGIFYVASGAACRAEAVLSARSVKAAWPGIPIAIVTDAPVDCGCFDDVRIVATENDSLFKVRHIGQSPFDRTILLDADTYCLAPFPEVFDLLDRFDLAAAHEAGRFATRWVDGREQFIRAPDMPECFPELNTGVIAFRRQANILALFERWLVLAEAARAAPTPHTQDQPSFRRALYESDVRAAVLPPEYNFRLVIPGFARGLIKLIHGRWKYGPIGDTPGEVFAALARTFNENLGPRTFVHAFGMICGHGPFAIAYDDPERTCELGEVRNFIAERDRSTAERDRAMAERDGSMAERDGYKAERDRLLLERDDLMAESDRLRADLAVICGSKSWRLTRPLRLLRGRLAPP